MITDPIFYRLFETSPAAAREMAARYQYEALEFKEAAHRADGVFRPKEAGLPLYFLEVQFYHLPSVFADLLVKVYTYLKQHDLPNPLAEWSCSADGHGSRRSWLPIGRCWMPVSFAVTTWTRCPKLPTLPWVCRSCT